ncbi:peptidase family M1-domain-containing protein [Pisolithus orientalis]|uniref:peptidase family M1-domain-containing protein n=1 Tax=Pisolithus orientalis TaxID=936130 RepID=UPI002225268A|nr:peptidase family M1-domain-containing protein [Pisolithus orientalis]KAI5991089.1 peptidase family M1-domain-containing protein [Pisolithus orientalis]
MADPSSQSNYISVAIRHLSLEWSLDFPIRTICGTAVYELEVKGNEVAEVILDTADLVIDSVHVDGSSVEFSLGAKHPVMGSALHIPILHPAIKGGSVKLAIKYETTTDCMALQWLDKEQTQGGKFPFLFSQCQPIYARSLVPIQDTPSVKFTYNARVTAVLPVLMSAILISPASTGPPHDGRKIGQDKVTYVFLQSVPIPSYLLAIASGNLRYRPLPVPKGKDWTSGVWAEEELADAAEWEFKEDTTKFLEAEEKITVPYRFGVYDLLVLPPSFPYGGMENACVTFVTPTLLTGDRTLVDVVVHEITHSWFGNGITHANACHFWLNEGWTTYIERLLQQILRTPAHRDFSFLIGSKMLYDDLKLYESRPAYQRLEIAFEHGENPDDAYSSVPYEKGANFLLHIERTLGGLDVFLPYIRNYVQTFMGKSITTQEWKDHLYAYYREHGTRDNVEALDSLDWDAWLHGEGLTLPVPIEYDMTLARQSNVLADRWDKARTSINLQELFDASDLQKLDANQVVVFLERLQSYAALPKSHINFLGSTYSFATTPNAEIRLRFYQVALLDPQSDAAREYAVDAAAWVVGRETTRGQSEEGRKGVVKGRMKFCRPIFRALYAVDAELALGTYRRHKLAFHPIARNLIEKVRTNGACTVVLIIDH